MWTRTGVFGGLAALAWLVIPACSEDASPEGAADGSVTDSGDGGVRPDGGPCGADKTPFETNCTPTEGTFVKPGATGGDGTIGKPLGSLATALAKGGNIYVCAGTLSEKIALSSTQVAAKVYGGLDCATWRFADGAATKVVAQEAPAFQASDVVAPVEISDVSFETTNGATAMFGVPRIAAFVSDTQALSFVRSAFKAPAGRPGFSGDDHGGSDVDFGGPNTRGPADGKGNNAVGAVEGAEAFCTCADGTTTTGGAGGALATRGGDGSAIPFVYADVAPFTGSGGNGGCSSGAGGQNGKAGAPGGPAASAGYLSASMGWTPSIGTSATPSNAGQGGGGGGGAAAAGGSGGCGGCGGTAGKGGSGGGGSIAFASIGSTVAFAKCSFSVGAGGIGGKGGKGLDGQAGGSGGTGACMGGSGGNGAGGSGGGGGNGGVSAGIAYIGARPSVDAASTFNRPSVGAAGGKGGEAGVASVTDGTHQGNPGLAGADGKDGEVADVFEVK